MSIRTKAATAAAIGVLFTWLGVAPAAAEGAEPDRAPDEVVAATADLNHERSWEATAGTPCSKTAPGGAGTAVDVPQDFAVLVLKAGKHVFVWNGGDAGLYGTPAVSLNSKKSKSQDISHVIVCDAPEQPEPFTVTEVESRDVCTEPLDGSVMHQGRSRDGVVSYTWDAGWTELAPVWDAWSEWETLSVDRSDNCIPDAPAPTNVSESETRSLCVEPGYLHHQERMRQGEQEWTWQWAVSPTGGITGAYYQGRTVWGDWGDFEATSIEPTPECGTPESWYDVEVFTDLLGCVGGGLAEYQDTETTWFNRYTWSGYDWSRWIELVGVEHGEPYTQEYGPCP